MTDEPPHIPTPVFDAVMACCTLGALAFAGYGAWVSWVDAMVEREKNLKQRGK